MKIQLTEDKILKLIEAALRYYKHLLSERRAANEVEIEIHFKFASQEGPSKINYTHFNGQKFQVYTMSKTIVVQDYLNKHSKLYPYSNSRIAGLNSLQRVVSQMIYDLTNYQVYQALDFTVVKGELFVTIPDVQEKVEA